MQASYSSEGAELDSHLLGDASKSCPLTTLDGLFGLGGAPREDEDMSEPPLVVSLGATGPLLEPGRLGLDASKPADLIAASSSLLEGNWI